MRTDGLPKHPLVGVIGTGAMGTHLVTGFATRFPTLVYDLDLDRALAAVDAACTLTPGATCEVVREIMALTAADILITMLPDSDAVDTTLWRTGLAAALRPGSLVIDMGSSEPERTRNNADRLGELGIAMLDAPVSGGVGRARSHTLTVIVGGPEDVLERARPVLDTVAESIFHVGPSGAGHAAKALNNLLSACGLLIGIEAVEAGRRYGIEPRLLIDVLNHATGRNHATETKIAQYVLTNTYDSGFLARLMVKDLRIAGTLFDSTKAERRLADAVISAWIDLTDGLNPEADQTAIAEVVRRH